MYPQVLKNVARTQFCLGECWVYWCLYGKMWIYRLILCVDLVSYFGLGFRKYQDEHCVVTALGGRVSALT